MWVLLIAGGLGCEHSPEKATFDQNELVIR